MHILYSEYLECLVHVVHRSKVPLSPDTSTRNGYLWLYEDKLPRIRTYGIETYLLVYCLFLFRIRSNDNKERKTKWFTNTVRVTEIQAQLKKISKNNCLLDQKKWIHHTKLRTRHEQKISSHNMKLHIANDLFRNKVYKRAPDLLWNADLISILVRHEHHSNWMKMRFC